MANAPKNQRSGASEGEGFSALVDSNAGVADNPRPRHATPRAAAAQNPASPSAKHAHAGDQPATAAPDKPKAAAPGPKPDKTAAGPVGETAADAPADDSTDETSVAATTVTGLDIGVAAVAVAAPQLPAAQADATADLPAGIAATAIARVTADTDAAAPAIDNIADTDADATGTAKISAAIQTLVADAQTAAASAQKSASVATAAAGETDGVAQDIALAPVAANATDVIKATKGATDRKAEPKPADAPSADTPQETSESDAKTATPVASDSPRHQLSAAAGAHDRPASDVSRAESGAAQQDRPANSTNSTLAHNTADFANQLQLGAAPAPNATVTAATPQLNAAAATAAQVPVQAIAAEITANVQIGRSRFEIRLDPPELGRIDVRLDVDRQGNVTSHLIVEKASTLDFLRRDAQQLERALQDAGLKTSDNSLQFSLRDQQQQSDRQADHEPPAQRLLVPDEETPVADAAGRTYGRMIGLRGGLDIRV